MEVNINQAKESAQEFYNRIIKEIEEKHKELSRIKFVEYLSGVSKTERDTLIMNFLSVPTSDYYAKLKIIDDLEEFLYERIVNPFLEKVRDLNETSS